MDFKGTSKMNMHALIVPQKQQVQTVVRGFFFARFQLEYQKVMDDHII